MVGSWDVMSSNAPYQGGDDVLKPLISAFPHLLSFACLCAILGSFFLGQPFPKSANSRAPVTNASVLAMRVNHVTMIICPQYTSSSCTTLHLAEKQCNMLLDGEQ